MNFTAGRNKRPGLVSVLSGSATLRLGILSMRCACGIPWYGFRTRLLGWHSEDPFDYAVSGHWHTAVRMQVNRITAWGAGSTESANTYAKEWLASGGQAPSQWLLFQGHRGMAAEHLIRLDEAVA